MANKLAVNTEKTLESILSLSSDTYIEEWDKSYIQKSSSIPLPL